MLLAVKPTKCIFPQELAFGAESRGPLGHHPIGVNRENLPPLYASFYTLVQTTRIMYSFSQAFKSLLVPTHNSIANQIELSSKLLMVVTLPINEVGLIQSRCSPHSNLTCSCSIISLGTILSAIWIPSNFITVMLSSQV